MGLSWPFSGISRFEWTRHASVNAEATKYRTGSAKIVTSVYGNGKSMQRFTTNAFYKMRHQYIWNCSLPISRSEQREPIWKLMPTIWRKKSYTFYCEQINCFPMCSYRRACVNASTCDRVQCIHFLYRRRIHIYTSAYEVCRFSVNTLSALCSVPLGGEISTQCLLSICFE